MNQNFRLLLAFISLCYSIFLIQDTYAKYTSGAVGQTTISIARWNILVNSQDIKLNNDFSSTVTPILEGTDHIAPGILAPTAEGYFDIIIDATNADVSFAYSLSILHDTSTIEDLIITGYSINNEEMIPFTDKNYLITDTVPRTSTNKVARYRFFIKWDDSETASMDNQADTEATKQTSTKFNVTASFTQVAE